MKKKSWKSGFGFPPKYENFTFQERNQVLEWRYKYQKSNLLGRGAGRGDSNTMWGLQHSSGNSLYYFFFYKVSENKFILDFQKSSIIRGRIKLLYFIEDKIFDDLNTLLDFIKIKLKENVSEKDVESYQKYIPFFFKGSERIEFEKLGFQFGYYTTNHEYDYLDNHHALWKCGDKFILTLEKTKNGYVFSICTPKKLQIKFKSKPTKSLKKFLTIINENLK